MKKQVALMALLLCISSCKTKQKVISTDSIVQKVMQQFEIMRFSDIALSDTTTTTSLSLSWSGDTCSGQLHAVRQVHSAAKKENKQLSSQTQYTDTTKRKAVRSDTPRPQKKTFLFPISCIAVFVVILFIGYRFLGLINSFR